MRIFLETEKKSDFLVFGKPDIGDQEKFAVMRVLDSGWLSSGSVVKQFENEFEEFIGSGYAVALSSCTDALILSLIVGCVGNGAEVIVPPLTFAATVNAILAVGAKPVFVDVTPSGHIDPNQIEARITEKTRAIIPVHYTGEACEMDEIMDIADRRDLKVIEDAAHAFDGYYKNRKIGTIGDFTCFSFYATKNITCGEGGMVMTDRPDLADKIRMLSMQGLSSGAHKRYGSELVSNYEVSLPGRKSNLSDIHAAIGLEQLRRWKNDLKPKREAVWSIYEKSFGKSIPGHAKHLYTIRHPDRDGLRTYLYSQGIGTGIHFKPLHLEPAYSFLNYKKGAFPIAERIGETTLSLPVSATMTSDDAFRVVEAVKKFEGEE